MPAGYGCYSHQNNLKSSAVRQDRPPLRGRTLGDHHSYVDPGRLAMSRPCHLAPTLMRPAATAPVSGRVIACFLLALVCLNAGSPATAQPPTPQARAGLEPITPIPAMPPQDPRRLVLGEQLFSNPRLSHDDTRSCSSCHDTRTNGASANAHDLTPAGRSFP